MQCEAVIEDFESGMYYRPQRVAIPTHRQCSKSAVGQVKHLHLCATHLRLTRDGLVDERGQVAPRLSIRDVRRYPEKFRGGLYDWASK